MKLCKLERDVEYDDRNNIGMRRMWGILIRHALFPTWGLFRLKSFVVHAQIIVLILGHCTSYLETNFHFRGPSRDKPGRPMAGASGRLHHRQQ